MSDHADSRFTVLAKGLDDAVVSVPVGIVGLERGHQLGIYTKLGTWVNTYFSGEQRRNQPGKLGIYEPKRPNPLSSNDLAGTGIGVLINSR